MEEAAQRVQAGELGQIPLLAEHASAYITLIRDHIAKEDQILYPLAERVLPEAKRPALVAGYAAATERLAGVEEKYRELVESYEEA